jgi:hypothetical protein
VQRHKWQIAKKFTSFLTVWMPAYIAVRNLLSTISMVLTSISRIFRTLLYKCCCMNCTLTRCKNLTQNLKAWAIFAVSRLKFQIVRIRLRICILPYLAESRTPAGLLHVWKYSHRAPFPMMGGGGSEEISEARFLIGNF